MTLYLIFIEAIFCWLFLFFIFSSSKNKYFFNSLGACFFLFCIFVIGGQASSYLITGTSISSLVFSNISYASSAGTLVIIKAGAIFLFTIIFFISAFSATSYFQKHKWKNKLSPAHTYTLHYSLRKKTILGLLILFVATEFFINTRQNINSPSVLFIKSFISFVRTDLLIPERSSNLRKLFYKKELELSNILNYNKPAKKKFDNVILIFIEGLSANVISENLTPNLFRLSKNSLSFLNYYNHTAATFRGIRGQLTSGYQLKGGFYNDRSGMGQIKQYSDIKNFSRTRPISLIDILAENGWETAFISPHSQDDGLAYMARFIGFNHVYGSETAHKNQDLTDSQTLSLTRSKFLELKQQKKPFLLSTYTSGTHEGLDSLEKKYQINNPYFNKFFNLDHQLGIFLSWFNTAISTNNTLLVVTTDHASYPSKGFNQAFGLQRKYFLDKIPLFIYGKHGKHIRSGCLRKELASSCAHNSRYFKYQKKFTQLLSWLQFIQKEM